MVHISFFHVSYQALARILDGTQCDVFALDICLQLLKVVLNIIQRGNIVSSIVAVNHVNA